MTDKCPKCRSGSLVPRLQRGTTTSCIMVCSFEPYICTLVEAAYNKGKQEIINKIVQAQRTTNDIYGDHIHYDQRNMEDIIGKDYKQCLENISEQI